jgi:hypothetical protein
MMVRWAVVAAAVAAVAGCRPPPHPYRSSLPADLKPPVTLIGDSTMAAMVWFDQLQGTTTQRPLTDAYTVNMQSESCRKIATTSCRGRFGYTPTNALTVMRNQAGRLGEAVVIMAGYDDPSLAGAVDAIMAEANAQGVPRVLWLTYRQDVRYRLPGTAVQGRDAFPRHNGALWEAATRYPTLELVDWNWHTASHPEWFSWDGIHLTMSGAYELGSFLRSELDARPLGRCLNDLAAGDSAPGPEPALTPPGPLETVTPATPAVLIDTRPGGPDGADRMVGNGRTLPVSVAAATGATAYTARVVARAVEPCRAGTMTVGACGASPAASTPLVGGTDAEIVADVALGASQSICVGMSGQSDVVLSLASWQAEPAPPATTTTVADTTTTTTTTTSG